MPSFKDYHQAIAPAWLLQERGSMWLRGIGDPKDELEDAARQAILQRFPSYSGWDAVERIGGERQLDRGVTETESQYRARLRGAWDLWPKAGTPEGILNALHYAGYDSAYLACANGEVWNRDSGTGAIIRQVRTAGFRFTKGWWNEFRVFFVSPHPSGWSPSPPGNSSDEVKNIRRIINLWKPAHAKLDGFTVQLSGPIWGWPLTLDWGDPGITWGSDAVMWDAA